MSATETPVRPTAADQAHVLRWRSPRPASVLRAAGILFFFGPLVTLILGFTSKPIENRPLAPPPHWRLSWSVAAESSRYITDRLPLRQRAVQINAEVTTGLFHEAPATGAHPAEGVAGVFAPRQPGGAPSTGEAPLPAPKVEQDYIRLPPPPSEAPRSGTAAVLVGAQGWLYLSEDFYKECNRGQQPAEVVANLARLQRILATSGRKFVFTLAPDKTTAERDYLPTSYEYKACAAASKQETFDLLRAAGIPGYIDMQRMIESRQTLEHRAYYLRKDTHWNGLATAMLSIEVARQLDPRLLAGTSTRESVDTYTGDLTMLLGSPSEDQTLDAGVVRAGVVSAAPQQVSLANGINATRTSSRSTSAALLPGRTLVVGDSFREAAERQLVPFCAEMTSVRNGDFLRAPRTMAQQVQEAQTVVLVWIERSFTDPNYGVLWSTPFLDQLEASLTAR